MLRTVDYVGDEAEIRQALVRAAARVCREHGFRSIEVPTSEPLDLLVRLYGETIRSHLSTFTTDREMALRPNLTAGICRVAVGGLEAVGPLPSPLRFVGTGQVYRRIEPSKHRRGEFTHLGVERIGDEVATRPGADLELVSLGRLVLLQAGVEGGLLRVGHAELRGRLLEAVTDDPLARTKLATLLDATSRLRTRLAPPKTTVDRAADGRGGLAPRVSALEHPDAAGLMATITTAVRSMVSEETLGSIVRGAEALLEALEGELAAVAASAGLDHAKIEALLGLTEDAASAAELADGVGPLWPDAEELILDRLGPLSSCAGELEPLVLRLSLGTSRGPALYTGFTFEVEVPALGPDACRVLAGGRYDDLMATLGRPTHGAAGFAVGVDRLVAAVRALSPAKVARLVSAPPVLVCYGDHVGDAAGAASFADRLRELRLPLAFHPAPLRDVVESGIPVDTMRALAALPGHPYRIAVLVSEGRYFVAYLDDEDSFAVERREALTLLSH